MQDSGIFLPLLDPQSGDAASTGGKAAELSRLLQDGLPVPAAFILPVAVFNHHFKAPSPGRRPERPTLDQQLESELAQICDELCPGNQDQLAVRSSALGEDGVALSFAGQHATYYYITRDTVGKAIVDCWMSLWSSTALAYREAQQDQTLEFGMAVIVQRMIQSERSGVCFTEDPTGSLAETALLESTWGLGAALVDGRVSPDRFWIDGEGSIVDRKIARKRLKVIEDLQDPSGQRLEPVPLNQQTQPTLTDIEVTQIVAIAQQVAGARGCAQDVEWAIAGDELFILQSRPITTRADNPPLELPGRWVLFKPVAENFSEPFTPMTVDLFRRVLPPLGSFIQGRYYVNVDLMAKLLPWSLDDESLADLLLMRGTPPDQPLKASQLIRAAGILTLAYLSGGITWHRTARLPLATLQGFEQRCEQALADEALDPLATLNTLIFNDHPLRPMGEFAIQANISSIRYFLLTDILKNLLNRWAPAFDQTRLATICSGGSNMLSQQMVEGVRELARGAAADPLLCEAMLKDDVDLPLLISRLDDDHPLAISLQQFMQRFGHRAVRELDLLAPRWREDNSTVLAMVKNFLRADDSNAAAGIDPHGLLLASEDELHQSIQHRWQRKLVDYLIKRIRYYVTLRENTRHYHTMGIATVRSKLKRLEQKLLAERRLRCEDDIFFLEHGELMALESGVLEWLDVEPSIRRRRLDYQRLSQLPAAESFNLKTRIPVLAADKNILMGDCASPGVAMGTARVIHDPTVAADLAAGDILVAPYTDPAWTPLFPGAAAIIVEVGSYLSHAGTVAREYQVPCLVDVHACTRRIRSGQQLRVNATEGWVEIVE